VILNMDFKPIVEKLSLEQGDGHNYASHVAEIIDKLITDFIISLSEVENPNTQASILIDDWLKYMRNEVNNKNQSVSWAENLLVLLVKTLDCVKDWHPYLIIIDTQLKSILPKHYKFYNI
jgi:hypothetical protein